MKRVTILLILLLLSCSTAMAASLTLVAQEEDGQLKVDVAAADFTDLAGIQFGINYDANLLGLDRMEERSFLNEGGAVETRFPTEMQTTGQGKIEDIILFRVGEEIGVSGSGVLLSIYFIRQGSEEGDLTFTTVLLSDSLGQPILADLHEITTIPVEEPQQSVTTGGSSGGGGGGGGGGYIAPQQEQGVVQNIFDKIKETFTKEEPEEPAPVVKEEVSAPVASGKGTEKSENLLTGNVVAGEEAVEKSTGVSGWLWILIAGAVIGILIIGALLLGKREATLLADHDALRLSSYVHVMRAHGRDDQSIREQLRSTGWEEQSIDDYLFATQQPGNLDTAAYRELTLYLYAMAERGIPAEQITQHLLQKGWKQELVQHFF